MTTLLPLAWRLARAGGTYRLAAQVGVNVLGGLVLTLAFAVPRAALPPGSTSASWLALAITLAVGLMPLVILLVTVGRLSAATRDRRLASLRVLGLGPSRTRAVGATEAALLAGAGALVGAALAAALAPLVDGLVPDALLVAPLRVTVVGALAAIGVPVVVAGLASTAGTRRLTGNPLAQRATSTRRVPLPWALAPLGAGLLLTAWVALGMPGTVKTLDDGSIVGGVVRLADVERFSVPVGLAVGACVLLLTVAAAYVPALLTAWSAALLVRSRRTAAVLAGRGVQTEPTSVSRIVASVGVVVMLATCGAGYLGTLSSDPTFRLEKRAVEGGAVGVHVTGEVVDHGEENIPNDVVAPPLSVRERDVTAADLEALRALPGVVAVAPMYSRTVADGDGKKGAGIPFVGTCAELGRVVSVEGCRDDVAATIVGQGTDDVVTGPIRLVTVVDAWRVVEVPVTLAEAPLRVDALATAALWGGVTYGNGWDLAPFSVFVPTTALGPDTAPTGAATVYVEGGPEAWEALADDAAALGLVTSPVERSTYDSVRLQQTLLLAAATWFVGIAALGIALAAIDRQRERRRTVGRLVAVGVPARTLVGAQAWQVLLPLATAVVVAVGVGLTLVGAVAWSHRTAAAVLSGGMPLLLAVVGIVVVLVAVLTLPAATTRLTPELLREE
ncbi:FtsX-like permease family protein [Sanguibacter massiliensis]|uniref:FtsX-like permease family protein n=1 Tax=Sanguibacter massiliensis TaxID=1973217 RepID=UPI00101ADCC6|nr:FtsX-like permease family protein [Sanguibacter massiliensis]